MNHAIFRDVYDKFHLHELKKISLLPWPAGIINLLHFRRLPLMFYHHIGLTVTWKIHSRLFLKISKPTHISLSHHKSTANISRWIFSLLHYSELCIWIVGLINPVVGLLNEWHVSPDCKGLHVILSSYISLGMKKRPLSFSEIPNTKASNLQFK